MGKKVYILHTTDVAEGRNLWIVFDEKKMVTKRTKKKALEVWEEKHGNISTLVRIKGICRPSEAAAEVADRQLKKDSE